MPHSAAEGPRAPAELVAAGMYGGTAARYTANAFAAGTIPGIGDNSAICDRRMPLLTSSWPPLKTVVLLALPPRETNSVPPLDIVVPIAVPALPTTCDPA